MRHLKKVHFAFIFSFLTAASSRNKVVFGIDDNSDINIHVVSFKLRDLFTDDEFYRFMRFHVGGLF